MDNELEFVEETEENQTQELENEVIEDEDIFSDGEEETEEPTADEDGQVDLAELQRTVEELKSQNQIYKEMIGSGLYQQPAQPQQPQPQQNRLNYDPDDVPTVGMIQEIITETLGGHMQQLESQRRSAMIEDSRARAMSTHEDYEQIAQIGLVHAQKSPAIASMIENSNDPAEELYKFGSYMAFRNKPAPERQDTTQKIQKNLTRQKTLSNVPQKRKQINDDSVLDSLSQYL